MNTPAAADVAAIWKSIAIICVTILIAGAPGIIYSLKTWGVASDVKTIRERQDDVRTRLAVLEQLSAAQEEQLRELRLQLQAHQQLTGE